MFSIHLFDGDVLIATRRCNALPSEANVRAIMAVRSADNAMVCKGLGAVVFTCR